MVCRVNTWLFLIHILYVAWIHDFVKRYGSCFVTLHPPGGIIFDKHDKSSRYLTSMTGYRYIFYRIWCGNLLYALYIHSQGIGMHNDFPF